MDLKKIEKGVRLILEGIGEDPERAGIKDTPGRVARMYCEIFSGLETPTEELLKIIEGESHDEMVFRNFGNTLGFLKRISKEQDGKGSNALDDDKKGQRCRYLGDFFRKDTERGDVFSHPSGFLWN